MIYFDEHYEILETTCIFTFPYSETWEPLELRFKVSLLLQHLTIPQSLDLSAYEKKLRVQLGRVANSNTKRKISYFSFLIGRSRPSHRSERAYARRES